MSEVISVIVPVYQVVDYLDQCLESIVNQTYRKLDIILVDDGSTDGSSAICQSYEAKDQRIRLIRQTNQGLSAARNVGLANRRGSYVTFVDSDDWLDPGFVEKLYGLAREQEADLVYGTYCRFREETGSFQIYETTNESELISYTTYLEWLFSGLSDREVTAWGKLYASHLFDGDEGLPALSFPPGRLNEDQYVTYQLFARSRRTIYLDQTLYCWRKRRTGSITTVPFSDKHILDDLAGQEERLLYLTLMGYETGSARRFFKNRLLAYQESLEDCGQVGSEAYRFIRQRLSLMMDS